MKYNLPKKYLSYSAIDKWLKSPKQFRKQYYENAPSYSSPELAFGKKIAELLEEKDKSMDFVPQLDTPEQQIQVDIDGVPIFGFIDSFDPNTRAFYEFKTGRKPWTEDRVAKHLQLDIYSLCIEEIYGSVEDECTLVWLPTEKIDKPKTGLITHEESYGIKLTGDVQTFKRVITDDERKATRELIVRVAKEISDDFTEYQSKPKGLVAF